MSESVQSIQVQTMQSTICNGTLPTRRGNLSSIQAVEESSLYWYCSGFEITVGNHFCA